MGPLSRAVLALLLAVSAAAQPAREEGDLLIPALNIPTLMLPRMDRALLPPAAACFHNIRLPAGGMVDGVEYRHPAEDIPATNTCFASKSAGVLLLRVEARAPGGMRHGLGLDDADPELFVYGAVAEGGEYEGSIWSFASCGPDICGEFRHRVLPRRYVVYRQQGGGKLKAEGFDGDKIAESLADLREARVMMRSAHWEFRSRLGAPAVPPAAAAPAPDVNRFERVP